MFCYQKIHYPTANLGLISIWVLGKYTSHTIYIIYYIDWFHLSDKTPRHVISSAGISLPALVGWGSHEVVTEMYTSQLTT